MTSQSPRIYIYKITFEEVPYYYYGVKKEKYFNEEYWGSPITNKWCWELYTPKKQILELFDFTDKGWLEALGVEKRLIKPVFNTDKWCLNAHCGGTISLELNRKNGKRLYELKLGCHKMTKEERIENSKKAGKIGGKKSYEMKLGVHGRSKEKMSEDNKKAGKIGGLIGGKKGGITQGNRNKENGIGFCGFTQEQRSEYSKITNSQKWVCLETGFISTSGPLTIYQKKRNIDTSKRKRIS
jgi:hypothetical protein